MNKLGETIQCAMCGVSMVRKSGKHMHCDACRVKRKNQRCLELYAQDKAQKNKSNMEDIARIDAEAKAAGMSYGKYVAMQYMKGK